MADTASKRAKRLGTVEVFLADSPSVLERYRRRRCLIRAAQAYRSAGWTLQQIADVRGVCRQRAWQIVKYAERARERWMDRFRSEHWRALH